MLHFTWVMCRHSRGIEALKQFINSTSQLNPDLDRLVRRQTLDLLLMYCERTADWLHCSSHIQKEQRIPTWTDSLQFLKAGAEFRPHVIVHPPPPQKKNSLIMYSLQNLLLFQKKAYFCASTESPKFALSKKWKKIKSNHMNRAVCVYTEEHSCFIWTHVIVAFIHTNMIYEWFNCGLNKHWSSNIENIEYGKLKLSHTCRTKNNVCLYSIWM